MTTNIFEKATRTAIRFQSARGDLTVEDVWNLPLEGRTANALSLDSIGIAIKRQLKESEEESLVAKKSPASTHLQLKFDIIKHIIDVKITEREAKKEAEKRKVERERLQSVVARKEEQKYDNMTLEEAQKKLAEFE